MNLILKALAPIALFGTLALTTAAQAAPPAYHGPHNINHRQADQQRRIDQGVHRGSLTPREAAHLEYRDARIARQESRDRTTGGRFTAQERRRIEREESHSSRAIYRQKHDGQHDHNYNR